MTKKNNIFKIGKLKSSMKKRLVFTCAESHQNSFKVIWRTIYMEGKNA